MLAEHIDPDILFLAECELSQKEVLAALNASNSDYFYNKDLICEKILMFSKFQNSLVAPGTGSKRYTIRKIRIPEYTEFSLMCLHYQSKVNWDDDDQAMNVPKLNRVIKEFEEREGSNTIVIGDFNMNPFEKGMIAPEGLHSVMTKEIALKGSRTVDGEKYPFFYNPMWSFYGDHGKGEVSGTAYFNMSKPVNYYWHMFDQVLIRPGMLPFFDESKLEIITKLSDNVSLLKETGVIEETISDHLPISVTLLTKQHYERNT